MNGNRLEKRLVIYMLTSSHHIGRINLAEVASRHKIQFNSFFQMTDVLFLNLLKHFVCFIIKANCVTNKNIDFHHKRNYNYNYVMIRTSKRDIEML